MASWSKDELKLLRKYAKDKPAYISDYQLAGQLTGKFQKSAEAIRWQLREFRRDKWTWDVPAPKILVVDLETLPIEALVFKTRKVFISPQMIKKDWSLLSWSAKWLYEKKVYGQVVTPDEAINREDYSIVKGLWNLMNEAHAVITYNGNGFDLKRMNTRFLVNDLPRPMYTKSVDLFQTIIQNFDFTWASMDYVNSVLGVGRKVDTSFKWWAECADGNRNMLKKMLTYNKQDVNITEELYTKLRPWVTSNLNLNTFSLNGTHVCGVCGSADLDWNGEYSTALGLYKACRCQNCKAIGRSTLKKYKIQGSEVRN